MIKKKTASTRSSYVLFLFIAFVIYVMISISQGLWDVESSPKTEFFGYAFIMSAIISCIAIAIQCYREEVIDRRLLALTTFFSIESTVFLLGHSASFSCFYDIYAMIILLCSLIIGIGIITTFCSPAGFVGVMSDDKKLVRTASLILLAESAFLLLLVLCLQYYRVNDIVSAYVIPSFGVWLLSHYARLGEQVRNGKIEHWI